MNLNNNILNTIGNTPLVKIDNIYAKLETYNPTGSIKDRMAWYMIKNAEERGELTKGQEIIEVTSGNTGIALAMISAIRGYKFTAIMPESMSIQRRKMIRKFGGNIILTSAKEDMKGAVDKYNQYIENKKNIWLPKQFENKDNYKAYEDGLGQEIIRQTNGKIDAFIAGMGTSGTIIGVAKALKDYNSKIKIIGVLPFEFPHKIQGIGEGFAPKILEDNKKLIDEIIKIKSSDAIKMSNQLAYQNGLLVGISSGANMIAGIQVKGRFKNIVTVLPDRGERYL
ncbi:MAG: cysteine synthase family protein [Patescibacteria group bacterium]